MRTTGKFILKIVLSLVIAFVLVNGLCFGYKHLPKAFNRSVNVTEMVWNPGSYIVQGSEGIGVYAIDKNGFLNDSTPDEHGSYILALGASHTEGKEVPKGQRYTDILNKLLQGSHQDIFVYNMGMDSHYFNKLVAGFSSVVQEFPDAEMIILEVSELNFSAEELEKALEQRPYDEMQSASGLKQKSSYKEKIVGFVKENIPFLTVIKTQFADFKLDLKSAFGLDKWLNLEQENDEKEITEAEYYDAFCKMARLLRSEWDGEIVILYHPSVELTYDGDLICDYPNNYSAFYKACTGNGLSFVDMGAAYMAAWQEDYVVPRGFHNTTMGYGHINKYGHGLIAEELYLFIQEEIE